MAVWAHTSMKPGAMTKEEMESLQQAVASEALQVRARIETAIHTGELPVWVMQAADVLERAVLLYGAATDSLRHRLVVPVRSSSGAIH